MTQAMLPHMSSGASVALVHADTSSATAWRSSCCM
jgi:hypothetical protein